MQTGSSLATGRQAGGAKKTKGQIRQAAHEQALYGQTNRRHDAQYTLRLDGRCIHLVQESGGRQNRTSETMSWYQDKQFVDQSVIKIIAVAIAVPISTNIPISSLWRQVKTTLHTMLQPCVHVDVWQVNSSPLRTST